MASSWQTLNTFIMLFIPVLDIISLVNPVQHTHLFSTQTANTCSDCCWRLQDDKHLARITPALKSKYRLYPSKTSENSGAGVNMSLLAYAGPYKAIGQGIRWVTLSYHRLIKVAMSYHELS